LRERGGERERDRDRVRVRDRERGSVRGREGERERGRGRERERARERESERECTRACTPDVHLSLRAASTRDQEHLASLNLFQLLTKPLSATNQTSFSY